MINYFNFMQKKDDYLLTNDLGRFSFVNAKDFERLISGKEDEIQSDIRNELIDNFFIIDGSKQLFYEKAIPYVRDAKNHLFSSTGLFIFVMTNMCNLNCVYCQAQSTYGIDKGMMSKEVADRGIEIMLQSPNRDIVLEFQGGEPLINFETIKYIIEAVKQRDIDKVIHYNLVSNLSLLTEEIAKYLVDNNVQISVSLDGPQWIHNANRPFKCGNDSFSAALKGIEILKGLGAELCAIQTTTRYSLQYWKEIVDCYKQLGFKSIFIRPLTQLGYASEQWEKIGYSAEEFLEFYKKAMDYILKLNNIDIFIEGHAHIMLQKIVNGFSSNYMELRSPCGATLGQIAIYYDGNIYTCDEGRMLAEMGDSSFMLGNVFTCDYDDLISNNVCKSVCSASCLESLPECCDCAYQPYCGVCPVLNYALDKDLISKKINNNFRCAIYKGILDYIFNILHNSTTREANILVKWGN